MFQAGQIKYLLYHPFPFSLHVTPIPEHTGRHASENGFFSLFIFLIEV